MQYLSLYGSGERSPPDLIHPVVLVVVPRRRCWGGHDVGPLLSSPPLHPGAAAAVDLDEFLVRAELVAVAQRLWSNWN